MIFPAQVFVQDAAADAERFCWLMLYDSQGRVSDKSKVRGLRDTTWVSVGQS